MEIKNHLLNHFECSFHEQQYAHRHMVNIAKKMSSVYKLQWSVLQQ